MDLQHQQSGMRRRAALAAFVIVIVLMATPAAAQTSRPWLVRIELGSADIHRFVADRRGPLVGVRFAHAWRSDHIRFDFGVARSTADRGFVLVDAAFETRLCGATCRLAPFAGLALGTLVEPDYGHSRSRRLGGGLEVMLRPNDLIRVAFYYAQHSRDARGPHVIAVGYSRRLGR